jgi:hypothetical protein
MLDLLVTPAGFEPATLRLGICGYAVPINFIGSAGGEGF